jgi:hypothetical protein
MTRLLRVFLRIGVLAAVSMATACAERAIDGGDPLPSWNDGVAKQAIIEFVGRVTNVNSPDHVSPAERIAVFDNDGTLWSEQPVYFQVIFAVDRVKALAAQHPEWQETQPFKAALDGDIEAVMAGGMHGLLEMVTTTHAGNTTEEFAELVAQWLQTARHPTTGQPYTKMVYQPMLELMAYLRANGFKTYIVSGGGIEFMRPWTESVYGIPPEQVIGSSIKTVFETGDGTPRLVRLPEMNFIDDGPGKPVGINQHIGRRPIFAFGNSDGDQQMLQWTSAGSGARFAGLVRHTDGEREWAYDRDAHVGRLDKALVEAGERGWTIVDMKSDWKSIYPAN